jgi:hypothetical protein
MCVDCLLPADVHPVWPFCVHLPPIADLLEAQNDILRGIDRALVLSREGQRRFDIFIHGQTERWTSRAQCLSTIGHGRAAASAPKRNGTRRRRAATPRSSADANNGSSKRACSDAGGAEAEEGEAEAEVEHAATSAASGGADTALLARPALVANRKPGKRPAPTFPLFSLDDRLQMDSILVHETAEALRNTELAADPWRLGEVQGRPAFVRSGATFAAEWMQLPPPRGDPDANGGASTWVPMYVCASDLHTACRAPLGPYLPAAQVLCSGLHVLYTPSSPPLPPPK